MILDYVPVGIDVSGFWFDVYLVSSKKKIGRFANNPQGFGELLEFFGEERVHVCLEGTGGYERKLCLFLSRSGTLVSRVNPLLVRRFAEGLGLSHKTDKVDARVLAEFCRL